MEVSALLNVKVDGADFWVWSSGINPIGVGGGGGGGGGIIDEFNTGANDAGADFNGGSIDADLITDSVGADFDVDSVGADSDAGRIGVDFDAGSCGGNVGAGNADEDGGGDGGKASSSDITSSIIWRGGECTSTMLWMLCCVLSFPFDWELLSMEEMLDLLLLLMVPLNALMSSVKQCCKINLHLIIYPCKIREIIYRMNIWFICG